MVNKEEQPELNQKLKLDGTGAYHWSEPCTLEDVTMVSSSIFPGMRLDICDIGIDFWIRMILIDLLRD